MSFLQPWMLLALPLAVIPVIIHLLNQRRYQSTQWAAMMFLLAANQMNRGYARIRQWLILMFRTVVIGALIVAVGRPLASHAVSGGAFGAWLSGGSTSAIVLLDRSPSMQRRLANSPQTALEYGRTQIAEALDTLATQEIVLIDSNLNQPTTLTRPDELLDLPEARPASASADLPAMLLSALEYLDANDVVQTDIWICSDLASNDWQPNDGRWQTIRQAFGQMGHRVRLRVVAPDPDAFTSAMLTNWGVRVSDVSLDIDEAGEHSVTLNVQLQTQDPIDDQQQRNGSAIPVSLELAGSRSSVDVTVESGLGELTNHRVVLPPGTTTGLGRISIPADTNIADNEFFVAFDQLPAKQTLIVTDDDQVGRIMKIVAETPNESRQPQSARVVSPDALASVAWDETALVLWHAELPKLSNLQETSDLTPDALALASLISHGGSVIFFPPDQIATQSSTGESTDNRCFNVAWQPWRKSDTALAVKNWRGDSDLLAATESGTSLPVGTLSVHRVASPDGAATALATLENGMPLMSRVATSSGQVYFCGTTPRSDDSSLANDGIVLYVMIQRALALGATSLAMTSNLDAGHVDAATASRWRQEMGNSSALSNEYAYTSGVYRDPKSNRLLAVNRSEAEDQVTAVAPTQLDQLLAGLHWERVNTQSGTGGALVEEVWRAFLLTMLAAMIGESLLCLPKTAVETSV